REVRERGNVVAENGTRVGELRAGQLHPVAGVAGKSNRDRIKLVDLVSLARNRFRCRVGHSHVSDYLDDTAGPCCPVTPLQVAEARRQGPGASYKPSWGNVRPSSARSA